MHDLVDYWVDEYDWPKHERALNQIPRSHADVGGLSIHFVYVKGKALGGIPAMPLLLARGWPDSFWRCGGPHRLP